MNVLLLSVQCENPTGGIAVWTDHYLHHCCDSGIQCRIVNTEVALGQRVTRRQRLFGEISRTRRIFRGIRGALTEGTFDVAHLNTSCGPYGLFRDCAIAGKLRRQGIPVVTHYHCDIPQWINNPLRRAALHKLARISALNLVLCESSRRYLENMGIDSVKIPNFIDRGAVADNPKDIRDTLTRIFFVGRVSEKKGAAELYELARRFPDKHFVLAGGIVPPVDSWDKPANLSLIGKISSHKVKDIADEADLFLFPSHSEGFSLALMEAMARGLPCVAYDSVGANGDMLADGCGVTVPYGDVEALTEAVRRLEDPAQRKAISENAIAKVRDRYTTDAVLTLIQSLYKGIL